MGTDRGMAGYTDPEKEGWEERALARVHERQKKSRKGRRTQGITLFYDIPFRVVLDAAAAKRGISMNGYVRRSVIAMMCHDLGLKATDLGRHTARATGYGVRNPDGSKSKGYDDMEGFGPWHITGVDDGGTSS